MLKITAPFLPQPLTQDEAVTVASGATFDLAGFTETVGSLAGAGSVTSSATGTLTLTAGGDNSTTVFSGAMTNGTATSVGLTKTGNGILTLSGTGNTYTGATVVNAGTLNVTGSTAGGSNVTVAAAATLAGSGTVNGSVTLTGSTGTLATVSPGDATVAGSSGTLATATTSGTGVFTFNNYSAYKCDINTLPSGGSAGVNWDLLSANSIAFGTSAAVKIYVSGNPSGFTNTTGYTWKIASATGANITTFANATFTIDVSGFTPALIGTFSVVLAANNKDVNLVYNPNPVPTITSFTPLALCPGQTQITITGNYFTGATAVNFGGANTGTNLTVVNATTITVTTPASTSGSSITVTTPGGTSAPSSGVNGTFSINALPGTPTAGTPVSPTCSITTGSVPFTNLPSGSWTITASPGGATATGSGTSGNITGLTANQSYTFTVSNGTCSSAATSPAWLSVRY